VSIHHGLWLLGGDLDPETELPRYQPGGTLPGVVRLEDSRKTSCRGVQIVARWRVTGRGTPDEGQSTEKWVHRGRIEPGASVEIPFEYPLPHAPWSYQGELIEIVWELEAKLDIPRAGDHTVAVPFILAPGLDEPGASRRRGAASRKRGD